MNSTDGIAQPAPAKSNFYPTFFLALFLGSFGVHRFYTGKVKSGILQLVTLGGCGIWAFVDLVTILLGKFKDRNGVAMPNVNPKLTWPIFVIVLVVTLASVAGNSGTATKSSGSSRSASSSQGESAEAFVKRTVQDSSIVAGGVEATATCGPKIDGRIEFSGDTVWRSSGTRQSFHGTMHGEPGDWHIDGIEYGDTQ